MVKISVIPILIYRFSATPIKISESYFVNIDKLILKVMQKDKRSRIAKRILKNKVKGLTLPNFKLTLKLQ